MAQMSPEDVARRAIDGNRDALDSLVKDLQGDIYGLALRMLWNREDAEDATQEILVRVVTRLSQFDFRSRLRTWVYRVAVSYILDVKKSPVERLELTFETFAEDLAQGVSTDGPQDAERSLLVEEVKMDARSACSNVLIARTASRTCSGKSSICQGRRRLTPWKSRPTFFVRAFNTHGRPSCRSRQVCTCLWRRIERGLEPCLGEGWLRRAIRAYATRKKADKADRRAAVGARRAGPRLANRKTADERVTRRACLESLTNACTSSLTTTRRSDGSRPHATG